MNYKRLIFMCIICTAVLYSYKVYTDGTSNANGLLTSVKAREGKLLWQKYNCNACHQLYGLGGYMGPDLTNEIGTKGKAYAGAFITLGTSRMPNFKMSKDEVDDLVEYLSCVNKSGEYPLKNPSITPWGDINISITRRHDNK